MASFFGRVRNTRPARQKWAALDQPMGVHSSTRKPLRSLT